MTESDIPAKLLWVDLEMTGLDPQSQRIIEVAVIVTDFKLEQVAKYDAIIHQPEPVLEAAEEWPRENMKELFEAVRQSDKNESTVVDELVQFIDENFDEPAVLAGNSIHQDRRFIRRWWPRVEEKLHYRMLDVSSFKIWIQGSQSKEYEKSEDHRALGDIEESIAELQWSIEQLAADNGKD